MLRYLIEKLIGRKTKCWKCQYFLDHAACEKLSVYPRDKHTGFCNKDQGLFIPKSYNSSICINFKRNKNEK